MAADNIDLTDLSQFEQGPPYEAFRTLREQDPVHWNEEASPNQGFWSLTRQSDIVGVDRDEETFSSEIGAVNLEELEPETLQIRQSMIETDGARHWALRRLIQKNFTPKELRGYEPFLRELTRSTLDKALATSEFDFVKEISAEIPIRVLANMMDIPAQDTDQVIEWGNRMIGNSDPDYSDVLFDSQESEQYKHLPFRSPAALEVFEYGFAMRASRKDTEGNDLVRRLINQTPEDGVELSDRDFRNYFLLLIVAGNETTRHTISHSLRALLQHPEQLALLQERPELIEPAVEEFLRWATPIYHFRRTATRDVELRDKKISQGDKVLMWFTSGNRDEEVFEDPERFDVTRTRVDHVTFGKGGPHFCLGNGLARLEIKVLFEELLPRIQTASFNGEVKLMRSNFIHGIKEFPVSITTA